MIHKFCDQACYPNGSVHFYAPIQQLTSLINVGDRRLKPPQLDSVAACCKGQPPHFWGGRLSDIYCENIGMALETHTAVECTWADKYLRPPSPGSGSNDTFIHHTYAETDGTWVVCSSLLDLGQQLDTALPSQVSAKSSL